MIQIAAIGLVAILHAREPHVGHQIAAGWTARQHFYDSAPDGRISRVVGFFGAPPAP